MKNEPSCCDSSAGICTSCILADFEKKLEYYVRKRISNECDAEDVLQNIIVKIHSNIGSIADAGKIYSWVFTIAHNEIIDYYRRNDHTAMELTDDMEDLNEANLSENDEVLSCVKSTINKLPEKHKQAIILTEFKNMPQKELSEKLSLSRSGTKSRIQRARKKIKELMESNCELEIERRNDVVSYQIKKSCKDECRNQ